MENIERLEFEREETEQYLKKLETARVKLNSKGFVLEDDIPQEDRAEWKRLNDNFFKEKISMGETINQELIDSLSFYEFRTKPITTEDFTALAITKEEEAKLYELTDEQADFLEEEARERYYEARELK